MDNLSYSEPIVIGSQPVTAYEMIADITRMGEWSRVCKKCWWDDDASQGVGSWFTGRNEMGERTWETCSQVVAADQGHESAFIVGGDRPVGATASKRSTVAPRSPGPGSSSRATSRSSRSGLGRNAEAEMAPLCVPPQLCPPGGIGFDLEEAVPFCGALRTLGGADLHLSGAPAHGQVGEPVVLGVP